MNICFSYLKDVNGIGPVSVRVLPWFTICQTLSENIQVENGVVFRIRNLTLKQFHDVQESVQRATDVYDCGQKKKKSNADLNDIEITIRITPSLSETG